MLLPLPLFDTWPACLPCCILPNRLWLPAAPPPLPPNQLTAPAATLTNTHAQHFDLCAAGVVFLEMVDAVYPLGSSSVFVADDAALGELQLGCAADRASVLRRLGSIPDLGGELLAQLEQKRLAEGKKAQVAGALWFNLMHVSDWLYRDRQRGQAGGVRQLQRLDTFIQEMAAAQLGNSKSAFELATLVSDAQGEVNVVIKAILGSETAAEMEGFL